MRRVAAFLLLWFVVGQAVAACRHYTSERIDFEGEATAACAAHTAALIAVFPDSDIVQTSCTVQSNGDVDMVINYGGNPNQNLYHTLTDAGACASLPPDSSASAPNVGNVTLVLPDFLNLSAADGFLLSAAIVGVWAAAFAWRAVIRALGDDHDGTST